MIAKVTAFLCFIVAVASSSGTCDASDGCGTEPSIMMQMPGLVPQLTGAQADLRAQVEERARESSVAHSPSAGFPKVQELADVGQSEGQSEDWDFDTFGDTVSGVNNFDFSKGFDKLGDMLGKVDIKQFESKFATLQAQFSKQADAMVSEVQQKIHKFQSEAEASVDMAQANVLAKAAQHIENVADAAMQLAGQIQKRIRSAVTSLISAATEVKRSSSLEEVFAVQKSIDSQVSQVTTLISSLKKVLKFKGGRQISSWRQLLFDFIVEGRGVAAAGAIAQAQMALVMTKPDLSAAVSTAQAHIDRALHASSQALAEASTYITYLNVTVHKTKAKALDMEEVAKVGSAKAAVHAKKLAEELSLLMVKLGNILSGKMTFADAKAEIKSFSISACPHIAVMAMAVGASMLFIGTI